MKPFKYIPEDVTGNKLRSTSGIQGKRYGKL